MDIKIDDMLKAGLLTDERMGSNALGLITCVNAKATEMGVVKPEVPTEAGTGFTTTPTWPFPQFFPFGSSSIAVNKDAIGKYTTTVTQSNTYAQTVGVQYLDSSTFSAATGWVLGGGLSIGSGLLTKVASGVSTLSQLVGSYISAADTKLVMVVLDITVLTVGSIASVSMGGQYSSIISLRKGKNVLYVKPSNTSSSFVLTISAESAFTATSLTASAVAFETSSDNSGNYNVVPVGKAFVAASAGKLYISNRALGSWDTGFTYTISAMPSSAIGSIVTAKKRFVSIIGNLPGALDFPIKEAIKTRNYGDWAYDSNLSSGVLIGRRLSADADFPLVEELILAGYPLHTETLIHPYVLDAFRKGSMAIVNINATLSHIAELNDVVVVFTAGSGNGIYTVDWDEREDESVYTRLKRISSVAIHPSCTPVFYHGRLLFVSYTGSLYEVNTNFEVKRIGYDHMLSSLSGNNIRMVYRSDEEEVMISDGTIGFIFNEKLAKVTQFYPSVLESTTGIVAKNYGTASETIIVTSDIDIRSKGDAVLAAIHPAYRGLIKFRCRVHYKPDHSDTWRVTEWIYKFSKGFVIPTVMATDVRVEFRYEYESGVTNAGLYGATLEFQNRGRRNSRREFY